MTATTHAISTAADQNAVIIAENAIWTPSMTVNGEHRPLLSKGPENIGHLLKTMAYYRREKATVQPQIWLTSGATRRLGWGPDDIDMQTGPDGPGSEWTKDNEGLLRSTLLRRLDDRTRELLTFDLATDDLDGWRIFIPGYSGELDDFESNEHHHIGAHLRMSYKSPQGKYMVDLILTPWLWLQTDRSEVGILGDMEKHPLGDGSEDSAVAELGRRLGWVREHLGVLPGDTGARTAAAALDRIYTSRKQRNKGIVVTKPGAVPPINGVEPGSIESEIDWGRVPENDDFYLLTSDGQEAPAIHVSNIDQRMAYPASAGMIDFGYGELKHVEGNDRTFSALFEPDQMPSGLTLITIPAAASIPSLPEYLPPPHPAMRAMTDTTAWVTTQSILMLTAPLEKGGAGLHLEQLEPEEAFLFPQQGKVLETWKKTIAEAAAAAEEHNDAVMRHVLHDAYSAYLGRIANPEMWGSSLKHHHQPIWRADIIAHTRWRGRIKAVEIGTQFGLWPISGVTDGWDYLLPDLGGAVIDDSDKRTAKYLGKFRTKKHYPITDELREQLLAAADGGAVRKIVDTFYNSQ